ncbi:adaptor protein MecA [Brevibacillus migulae]|uniref:adaptor protein MecA n=1 Tax=Brevibacillus migulae TaxID=1644114 RepID=UPI00142FBED4|nr:adaptor protein MecA [Brevibacillus migulae]
MRIEFQPDRTILLFLDNEELTKRGFRNGDDPANIRMINELVDDVILFAASSATDFPFESPIRTEASYIPHEGAYIRIEALTEEQDEDLDAMQREKAAAEQHTATMLFSFADFEDLILCAHKMPESVGEVGTVYAYENKYYLQIDLTDTAEEDAALIRAVVSEYGKKADLAEAFLQEYGNLIFASAALQEIAKKFL